MREARGAGKSVLVVMAHPDDESLSCGGTLARLADAGVRIVLFSATRGERGGAEGPVRSDTLGNERVKELREAAQILGVSELILMDHPDGELRWEQVPELHAEILSAVRRFRPDALITFGADGLYWHPDHIGVFERTMTVLHTLGPEAPPVYHVTVPRGTMRAIIDAASLRGWTPPAKGLWSLVPDSFGLHAAAPTVIVDVRPWVERKLAALRCHQSQMRADHPFDRIGPVEAREWLGVEHFHRDSGAGEPGPLERLVSLVSAGREMASDTGWRGKARSHVGGTDSLRFRPRSRSPLGR